MKHNFFNLKFNQYYIKKNKKNNFSKNNYWNDFENFKDPDGKLRNLLNEKIKKLDDLSNEISFIKKKFKKIKNPRIIDLGSGFSFFLSAFGSKWKKYGVELSDLAIQQTDVNAKILRLDLEKKFSKKTLKELGKFDVVFSYHVIEHLNKPEVFIQNAYNLLKSNGYFILGTPNFDSACARRFKNNYRFYKDKTHISFFSENSLFRLLDDSGFSVRKVDYPYFETNHFTKKNLIRIFDSKKVSPAFYGNIMTFYNQKKTRSLIKKSLNFKIAKAQKLFRNK
jgi:2-polyprenyl-3-methyl-5-hydroxy-6-metoxy-1,4-benzoquinol methylase